MHQIRESDWKLLRDLQVVLVDRFCKSVLADVAHLLADTGKTNHERYGELYGLIKDRDKVMARLFDGMSRSNALIQLMGARRHELVSDEEFARFSAETRGIVERMLLL